MTRRAAGRLRRVTARRSPQSNLDNPVMPANTVAMSKTSTRRWLLVTGAILLGLGLGVLLNPFGKPPTLGSRSLAQLTRDLQRKDSRLGAIRLAVWDHLPATVQSTFPRLRPIPISEIRQRACRELGQLGPEAKGASPLLVEALDDPSVGVRLEALRTLRAVGTSLEAARNRLFAILRDPAYRGTPVGALLRTEAAVLLAILGPDDQEVISAILQLHNDADEYVQDTRNQALYELMLRSTSGPAIFDRALKDANEMAPRSLVFALAGALKDARAKMALLAKLLDHEDYGVQHSAMVLLAGLGPDAAPTIPKLTNLFCHTANEKIPTAPSWARSNWLTAMPRMAPQAPFSAYSGSDAVRSNCFGLHHQTMLSLGAIGPAAQAAIPLLIPEYRNGTNLLRFDAAVARWRIDGNGADILPVFAAIPDEPESRLRELGLIRLAEFAAATPAAIPILIQALADPDMQNRLRAIKTLASLGNKASAAVPALEGLYADPKYAIRAAAKDALRVIRPGKRN